MLSLVPDTTEYVVRNVFDDILVCATTAVTCEEGLVQCRKILEANSFRINLGKCTPTNTSVTFCGYRLDGSKLIPRPKRNLQSLNLHDQLPSEQNMQKKFLRSWLGVYNYVHSYSTKILECFVLPQSVPYLHVKRIQPRNFKLQRSRFYGTALGRKWFFSPKLI